MQRKKLLKSILLIHPDRVQDVINEAMATGNFKAVDTNYPPSNLGCFCHGK